MRQYYKEFYFLETLVLLSVRKCQVSILQPRSRGPPREPLSGESAKDLVNTDVMNENFGFTLVTMGLSYKGGSTLYTSMFSHQICTDLKNGEDEL